MKKSRFTETRIFAVLKEADAGKPVKEICRQHGISDATYYQWKSKYDGMDLTPCSVRRIPQVRLHFPPLRRRRAPHPPSSSAFHKA